MEEILITTLVCSVLILMGAIIYTIKGYYITHFVATPEPDKVWTNFLSYDTVGPDYNIL